VGNPVLEKHALSWAKRVITTTAIELLVPKPSETEAVHVDHQDEPEPRSDAPAKTIASMPVFERFVFVMTVLEKFSVAECAVLLRCARGEVVQARMRALEAIASRQLHEQYPRSRRAASAFAANTGARTRDLEVNRLESRS